MKSWKEDNMLRFAKNLREKEFDYVDEEDDLVDTPAKGMRGTMNSEYEFIEELLKDSGSGYWEESTEDYEVLAYESHYRPSTYRFYFDDDDAIVNVTEIMQGTPATEEDPDMGIWGVEDFDVVDTEDGPFFRHITHYSDGDSIADIGVPLF